MNRPNPKIRHRRSLRLKGYDYSKNGACFVTICVQNRECLFGNIVDGVMVLNKYGKTVAGQWIKTSKIRDEIDLDEWIVMPNHFHGILAIILRGTACRASTLERFGKPVSGSIPTVVRSFKSAVTKQINEICKTPGAKLWQRNYFEHIIRNDNELNCIREYIVNNPKQWEMDRENPAIEHLKRGARCRGTARLAPTPAGAVEPWHI